MAGRSCAEGGWGGIPWYLPLNSHYSLVFLPCGTIMYSVSVQRGLIRLELVQVIILSRFGSFLLDLCKGLGGLKMWLETCGIPQVQFQEPKNRARASYNIIASVIEGQVCPVL